MADNKKITELPDATLPIATGVKFEAVQGGINVKVDADDMPGSGGGTWGSITGTLTDQTDLNTALGLKAPLASPTFTGTPTAPTAAAGTNTTQVATTAFVNTEIVTDVSNGLAPADTTGTAISFAVPQTYGSTGTPETGNVTLVTTGLVKGCVQLLLHNHATTEPTWPTEFKRQGGVYVPAALNSIYMDPVSTTRINYWITQDI